MAFKFASRKIILSLLPHSFIRFFRKKINVNYLFFGPAKKNTGTYLLQKDDFAFTVYGMEEALGTRAVEGFRSCYQDYLSRPGTMRKYVLEVEDCIIEPEYGWGISSGGRLIFDSISNNAWIEDYHPSWFAYRRNKNNCTEYPELISINILKGGEKNYWHFLHDLLGQVALADKVLGRNIPLLISKDLYAMHFFKSALQRSPLLAGKTWLLRDKWYKVQKAWFMQTLHNSNEQFFDVLNILKVPDSDPLLMRKVFLKRNKERIRFIKNSEEIENIARKYGFEIVDTDKLTLDEQIGLFGSTGALIGIHGAGLTNVMFRKNAPMKVLEILPGDYLQPHYFWLSKGMGHDYSCVVGSVTQLDTSFIVDPVEFEQKLAAFF